MTEATDYNAYPMADGVNVGVEGTYTARTGSEYAVSVLVDAAGTVTRSSIQRRGAYGVPDYRATVPPTHRRAAEDTAAQFGAAWAREHPDVLEATRNRNRLYDIERLQRTLSVLDRVRGIVARNLEAAHADQPYNPYPAGTLPREWADMSDDEGAANE